jgi:hypothetical protein
MRRRCEYLGVASLIRRFFEFLTQGQRIFTEPPGVRRVKPPETPRAKTINVQELAARRRIMPALGSLVKHTIAGIKRGE